MSTKPLLIDSHIFIWLAFESEQLPAEIRQLLIDKPDVYVSDVTLLELAIKFASGKKRFPYSPDELLAVIEPLSLRRLPLTDEHLIKLATTILPHKDPFDALLVTQSRVEAFTFLTADLSILHSTYDVLSARM